MKRWLVLLVCLLLSAPVHAEVIERIVTRYSDDLSEGTLRIILQAACDAKGDDVITFAEINPDELRIALKEPLVIPRDCRGHVTIRGSEQVETILDAALLEGGGEVPGDSCTVHVYDFGHAVADLTLLNNELGAGVCLFGREGKVTNCRFGVDRDGEQSPNRYGIVVTDVFADKIDPIPSGVLDGFKSELRDNEIGPDHRHGIWTRAHSLKLIRNKIEATEAEGLVHQGDDTTLSDNTILGAVGHGMKLKGDRLSVSTNQIQGNGGDGIRLVGEEATLSGNELLGNGGCPEEDLLGSHSIECLFGGSGGVGLRIAAGSRATQVGGEDFDTQHNRIQYNHSGGIVIEDDDESVGHSITHNVLSLNYGAGPDLDLAEDGVTLNDPGDDDKGPNHLLNYIDYIQMFAINPSPQGEPRYWSWGLADVGRVVEVYAVATEDAEQERTHGGGDVFLGDAAIVDKSFELPPEANAQIAQGWVSLLSFDAAGNTSEFSANIAYGPDQDMDGIPDDQEPGDNDGSSSSSTDSDGDGLPDSVEDKNRNGEWDVEEGETAAYLADSDNDGINDWYETHGDGLYDVAVDTDPLNPDTDGDGLSDGMEDINANGTWEAFLLETHPLKQDSDGDGFADPSDTCPSLANPGQEPWFCGV